MTYCLGIRTQAGIVLIADTRTNAGIDNISNFRKLHVLADGQDQLEFCASAGSLSTTQNMLALLEEGPVQETFIRHHFPIHLGTNTLGVRGLAPL